MDSWSSPNNDLYENLAVFDWMILKWLLKLNDFGKKVNIWTVWWQGQLSLQPSCFVLFSFEWWFILSLEQQSTLLEVVTTTFSSQQKLADEMFLPKLKEVKMSNNIYALTFNYLSILILFLMASMRFDETLDLLKLVLM